MPAGLDTARRTAARVAAIRAPYPGTDTLAARTAVPEPPAAQALAPVVHLADRTLRPVRDDAGRVGQTAKIDGQNRINLGKLLGACGLGREHLPRRRPRVRPRRRPDRRRQQIEGAQQPRAAAQTALPRPH